MLTYEIVNPKAFTDRQEDINQGWNNLEKSANEIDWQWLFDRAKSIAESVSP